MAGKAPPHPGGIVREQCLDATRLNVTEGARVLGVTRQALNNLINGKAGLSAMMAIRLERAFGTPAERWLDMQTAFDLAQARARASGLKVKRYRPRPSRG